VPRIRSIHPDACDSEKLSTLSDSAERTFFRLLTHTDDEGRGEDRPKLLAAKLYPLHDGKDAGTVDADLDELQGVGLLVRYSVSGKRYYAIPTFRDWQNPRHPTASKLPSPDDADPAPDRTPTDKRGSSTADRRKAPAGVGGGVGEGVVNPLSVADATDGEFEAFWNAYPRHHDTKALGGGGVKKTAKAAWRRLSGPQRQEALAALDTYAKVCRPDGQKPKHAERFLRGDAWKPYLPDAAAVPRGDPCPECDRDLSKPDHDELCAIWSGRKVV
jgi:hypothetical protein